MVAGPSIASGYRQWDRDKQGQELRKEANNSRNGDGAHAEGTGGTVVAYVPTSDTVARRIAREAAG